MLVDPCNTKEVIELYDLPRNQQVAISRIVYDHLVSIGKNPSSYSVALDVEFMENLQDTP